MDVPNMPKFEDIVANGIVTNIKGCSCFVSELEPVPASYVQQEQKSVPYTHPQHKS